MKVAFSSFEIINEQIQSEIYQSFTDFYESKWYILGERVAKFERDYAEFNKVSNCVGVSNGLDALHIALKVLGVGKGDEVIIPSNTYIATALAVTYVGATPVFVEPDIQTYNLNPQKVLLAITAKTKAIIPVHLYGQACQMNEIMDIAAAHNLYIVEDNAQAQGALHNDRLTGSFGHINATSFYPGKNLGAFGDAGAVTTNNIEMAKMASTLRNYGSDKKYYNDIIGFNMRLDECQAGFLSVKLKYLQEWTLQRQQIAVWYNERLQHAELDLPVTHAQSTHVYHLYVIRTKRRDQLQQHLKENGIETLIHYPIPPHLQQAYNFLGFEKGAFPIAEQIADTCLSLPIWPGMTKEHVSYTSDKILDFFK